MLFQQVSHLPFHLVLCVFAISLCGLLRERRAVNFLRDQIFELKDTLNNCRPRFVYSAQSATQEFLARLKQIPDEIKAVLWWKLALRELPSTRFKYDFGLAMLLYLARVMTVMVQELKEILGKLTPND